MLHVFVLDLMIVNRGNFGEGGGQRTNQHQRLNQKHAQVQLCLTLSSSNFVVGRGCIKTHSSTYSPVSVALVMVFVIHTILCGVGHAVGAR